MTSSDSFGYAPGGITSPLVTLIVPKGVTTAYDLSGQCFVPNSERRIMVDEVDVPSFRVAAFWSCRISFHLQGQC